IAEHILITNLGTASFRLHTHATEPRRPRLRYLRITLKGAGFPDVDAVIAEEAAAHPNGTLPPMPPSKNMTRRAPPRAAVMSAPVGASLGSRVAAGAA